VLEFESFEKKVEKICVVGLGYVGLPLAVAFSKQFFVIGFDINKERVNELKNGIDKTLEVSKNKLNNKNLFFTNDPRKICECRLIIITVPTPIDNHNIPDLNSIKSATYLVGQYMDKKSIIVYESTVYPGLTEEICVPILEKESGLKWKIDFFVGYSPERINPGDKKHTIENVIKIVAGDTYETTNFLYEIYSNIVKVGVYKAPNIKTAEAAKVIENTQRDLNIALINELSIIFNKLGIDTREVLKAASTKWNFLYFEPGLVGGHCIGVDPYYLTFKAQSIGYHPEVILAGRRINDYMGKFIAENTVKMLIKADKSIKGSKVIIFVFTFKENIGDIRNTKVFDVFKELNEYGINVDIYDPFASLKTVQDEYSITLIQYPKSNAPYDAIIYAVKHNFFRKRYDLNNIKDILNEVNPVLIDIKGIFSKRNAEENGFLYWRL